MPSLTTPISLIKHATFAERLWFQRTLGRLTDDDCDGPLWAHGGFEVGDDETVIEVIAQFERASARARSIAARISLDEVREHPHTGAVVSLRWIYVFMTAEFARHAGHGNILREQSKASWHHWHTAAGEFDAPPRIGSCELDRFAVGVGRFGKVHV